MYYAQNGCWFPIPGNRTSTTGRTTMNTNPHGFLPAVVGFTQNATGQGNTFGAAYNLIGTGTYWTSIVLESQYASALQFNSTHLWPSYRASFAGNNNRPPSSRPVRCVRNSP